jgi:hypothetical protein
MSSIPSGLTDVFVRRSKSCSRVRLRIRKYNNRMTLEQWICGVGDVGLRTKGLEEFGSGA